MVTNRYHGNNDNLLVDLSLLSTAGLGLLLFLLGNLGGLRLDFTGTSQTYNVQQGEGRWLIQTLKSSKCALVYRLPWTLP